MTNNTYREASWPRWIPWILGVLALAFYVSIRARDISIGSSAQHLNAVCGYYFLPITVHYLYTLLGSVFIRWAPGSPLLDMTLFSALCGSFSVMLFYHIMARLTRYDLEGHEIAPDMDETCSRFGSLVATLLFAVSLPLWFCSSRPQSLIFDLLLLLSSIALLLRYKKEDAGHGWLLASVFLYGLGITEYVTMAVLSPLFGIAVAYLMLRRGQFTPLKIWMTLAAGILGLLFYLIPVTLMARTHDYGYGEYANAWAIFMDLIKKQYREFKQGFPQVGGLLLLLFTFVPWCYTYFIPKSLRSAHAQPLNLTTITLLVLNGLGLFLLTELWFSPSQIVGGMDRVVLPYLFIASWAGYLAGYWRLKAKMSSDTFSSTAWRWFWTIAALINLLSPPVIAAIQIQRIKPFEISSMAVFTQNIIRSTSDRKILVTSGGVMDDMLLYFSREEDPSRRLVFTTLLSKPSVRAYYSLLYPEAGLVKEGAFSTSDFIKTLITSNALGVKGCAFTHPDMALSIGFQALPNGLVVFPVDDLKTKDPDTVFEANQRLL
ncbi:MAG: DUF2723 domain-containing protein, partial [Lentisphaerota bacterium]